MRILILVNPRAGNNRGVVWLAGLVERLDAFAPQTKAVVEPTRRGQILEQLRELAPAVDRIVVVGGDGTVSEVMDAICKLSLSLPIGVIPLGTGNDLARSVGLYSGRLWTFDEGIPYASTLRTTPLDLWSLNGRLTFNNCMSLGLDADVVGGFSAVRSWILDHPLWGRKAIYFAIYLLVWLGKTSRRVPSRTELLWKNPAGEFQCLALQSPRVLAVTNTPYYAAGALMAPEARVGDGLLEITLFPNMRHYLELMAMRIPALAKRGVQRGWWRIQAKALWIKLPRFTRIQADGEDVTDRLHEALRLTVEHRRQVLLLLREE